MIAPDISIKRGQAGFTFLEILVSLAIMSIVLVSVFRLHSGSLKLADSVRSKSLLPFIARQQLAEILSQPPVDGTLSGEIEEDGTIFYWSCTLEGESGAPFEEMSSENPIAVSPDQAKKFKALKLTVTEKHSGRTFSVTTWRYQGESRE